VETHLLQRHYDGVLRKGKLKGRYDRLQGVGKTASSTIRRRFSRRMTSS
jgi:preprotein translocase subunit SecY